MSPLPPDHGPDQGPDGSAEASWAWRIRPLQPGEEAAAAVVAAQVFVSTYAPGGVSPGLAAYLLGHHTAARHAALAQDRAARVLALVSPRPEGPEVLGGLAVLRAARACPVPHPAEAELETLYVLQALQGQGLGRRLLAAAQAEAAQAWGQALWLSVNAANTPSVAFYQRQGWAILGEDHFELEGRRHLNWVMAAPRRSFEDGLGLASS